MRGTKQFHHRKLSLRKVEIRMSNRRKKRNSLAIDRTREELTRNKDEEVELLFAILDDIDRNMEEHTRKRDEEVEHTRRRDEETELPTILDDIDQSSEAYRFTG